MGAGSTYDNNGAFSSTVLMDGGLLCMLDGGDIVQTRAECRQSLVNSLVVGRRLNDAAIVQTTYSIARQVGTYDKALRRELRARR